MKISLSTYAFDKYIKEGKLNQLTLLKKAKELGFDAVEYTLLTPPENVSVNDWAKSIKEEADKLGIEIVAYTVGAKLYLPNEEDLQKEVDEVISKLETASILGAKIFRHDVTFLYYDTLDGKSFDRMLPYFKENAIKITERAKELGIKTCTENHGNIAQDSARIERLYNAVNNENYGVLIDVGNFACVDEDSAKAVSLLAPYCVHAHVKDFLYRPYKKASKKGFFKTRACNYLKGCAIGDGIIPVKQCLSILKEVGYDGYVTLEYEGDKDCIKEIAKGVKRLKKYLNEI